jgi:DNA-binding CsgD family transcriptional regulator
LIEPDLGSDAGARIAQASTGEAVGVAFGQAVAQLGMTAWASGMVSGPRAVSHSPFHFVHWAADWLALYQARGFVHIDPCPRWAIVSGEAASWTDILRGLSANDPGRVVAETAADYGYHEGFVTPVRTRTGTLGLVSVGGGARGPFTLAERTLLQSLSGLALNRAEAILAVSAAEPTRAAFSLRERECHALLQQGFTDNEIGRVLGISGETVRFHLDNARKKVGARNRVHLAAMQLGA